MIQKILVSVIFLFAVITFITPPEEFPQKFPKFQTEDLNGNDVTNKIFDGKITAVLLWTTNSEPCIKILENLKINLPPNCQIIGLIGDKNFDEKIAKKFSSINQLKVTDDFAPLLTKIKVVPTVIFVDSQGNLIEMPQFVENAKFICAELVRFSQMDSPKVKNLKLIQEKFW